ncbi:DEAD/DEAH box helicase [Branchiibius hedensis]|nr:DEAD/DEAH box helicase [Branchiibius hedensis]
MSVVRDAQPAWAVLPIEPETPPALGAVATDRAAKQALGGNTTILASLTSEVEQSLQAESRASGIRKLFAGKKAVAAAERAARHLDEWAAWASANNLTERLATVDRHTQPISIAPGDLLNPAIRWDEWWAPSAVEIQIVQASVFRRLHKALAVLGPLAAQASSLRKESIAAGDLVRVAETRKLVGEILINRLRDTTQERLRLGGLEQAGFDTVLKVLEYRGPLAVLPGIGDVSATRIKAAARTVWRTTYDETPVLLDINERRPEAANLLACLHRWDKLRRTLNSPTLLQMVGGLNHLSRPMRPNVAQVVVGAYPEQTVDELLTKIESLCAAADQVAPLDFSATEEDPWNDFLRRPADYFAMLDELGFVTEDPKRVHGDLPDEIIEAVRRQQLDKTFLLGSLRGYQDFGARFALAQRKVIIGDEMGLGKTFEAIAVLAHARSIGGHHSMVICPAAVVTNWMRELSSKSTLTAHRLHGQHRAAALHAWVRRGGVAVTTFESLGWLNQSESWPEVTAVIVDEAHYIKNPSARRSARTTQRIHEADYAVLLTGTPMENRIDEFRTLVGYVRPDLLVHTNEFTPQRFRRQVAPAYLRRNVEDVLDELPSSVEVDEWLPLSTSDARAYERSVIDGNFMAMRQAAFDDPTNSEKLRRLQVIVAEAESNGRKVVVFSYFRTVLTTIAEHLDGTVIGPLTGSVPADARQQMVDTFSSAEHGAVLLAQIVAGGVGLNIQAASVVAICEPQLKPTIEWQAIARARRMGQLETVQVHRLLSEEGVDRRVTEILAHKARLFDEFARVSESANVAPEAFDISDAELAQQVVAAERERILSGPVTSQDDSDPSLD